MKTILVPQFNEFENYKFTGLKEVKIKNKPNTKDYNKVTKALPGMCVGYCPAIYTIAETNKPIEVVDFYDIRQKGVKKLKGHFITLKS
jgi:hypothetical protein